MERSLQLEVCLKICQDEKHKVEEEPKHGTLDPTCSTYPMHDYEGFSAEAPKEGDEAQPQDKDAQRVLPAIAEIKASSGHDEGRTQRKNRKRKRKRKVWFGPRQRRKPSKFVKLASLSDKNPILFLSDDESGTDEGETSTTVIPAFESFARGLEEPLNINTNSAIANKFAYPSRNDPEAVEVLVSDLQHLQDFVFVNDTIIDFYIKYLQSTEGWRHDLKDRLHFYNSFFYKKLHEAVQSQKIEKNSRKMQKLQKWTKGINIFDKTYLFVPIHDKLHWSLAIICLPGASIEVCTPDSCCILHFDSMENGHRSQNVFRMLRRYLVAEWEFEIEVGGILNNVGSAKREKFLEKDISAKRVKVPLQENQFDCGLFLLHFIECFVKEAPPTLRCTEVKTMFGRDWFLPQDASNKRETIRKTVEGLLVLDSNRQAVPECSRNECNP